MISHAKDIRINFNNQKSTMTKISQKAYSLKGDVLFLKLILKNNLKRAFQRSEN